MSYIMIVIPAQLTNDVVEIVFPGHFENEEFSSLHRVRLSRYLFRDQYYKPGLIQSCFLRFSNYF